MIDTAKTVGTAATFDPAKITALLSKEVINNIGNLEKAIFSLEYLGQLRKAGLDFIFKGGSAIQVVLGEKWIRLSVDADICSNTSQEALTEVLDSIYQKFNKDAFSFEPREIKLAGSIPFYSYIFKAPSITATEETRTCLLDVMGIKPNYATTQLDLKTSFFDSDITLTTPTVGALLGDKLTTIGPNTMGRRLADSRNGVEYAKHFYDIKNLQEVDFSFKECSQAFHESIEVQSKIRSKDFSVSECCEDMLFTCQVASLPQRIGEQLIAKLPSKLRSRALLEFRILQDGLKRFQPFLVQKLTYSWDDLRYHSALAALLTKMVQADLSEDKVKAILKIKVPTTKKEIEPIAEKMAIIPEEERWFIQIGELVNFPKILNAWSQYFFIDES